MNPNIDSLSALPQTFLENFNFTTLQLTCRAIERIRLPVYAGSSFRGVFGWALRRLSCVAAQTQCPDCPLLTRCAYPSVFETFPNPNLSIYRAVKNPPRPFVLSPTDRNEISPKENFSLEISLFGQAITHYPLVIQAISLAGEKGIGSHGGRYQVSKVCSLPSGRMVVEENRLINAPDALSARHLPVHEDSGHVTLNFETPVRIKKDGKLTNHLEFSTVVRNLLRRVALIGAFHCDVTLDIDFKNWIQKAEQIRTKRMNLRWFDWTRRSSRQKCTMQLGGLLGEVTYAGEIAPFLPLLALGEVVHLGKSATFGLGRYRLLENES